MIRIGTLDTPEAPAQQWRAGAAYDADRAATSSAQYVNALRHSTVRRVMETIVEGGHPALTDVRRAYVAQTLASSVERQAFHSGLGRVSIPVGVSA